MVAHISEIDSLYSAVTRRLIGSYETDTVIEGVSWEYVGRFSYETDELVDTLEMLLGRAKKLSELRGDLGRAAENDGRSPEPPERGEHYGEYVPSREAMERWGLADA